MALPQAVRDAEERSNALLNALQNGQQAPGLTPQAAPAAAPTPAPQADLGSPQPAGAQEDGSYKHRYEVLQGKYNAEVPRLMGQVATLSTKVDELTRQNAQLTEQVQKSAVAPQPLVRQEDLEEHGENLVDLIRRAAREEIATRDSKISELEQKLNSSVAGFERVAKKGFLEVLAEKVPDWAIVNDDPSFHRWLLERDPLSGRVRNDLLQEAHGQQDGERAANIFTAFAKTRDSWADNANASLAQQEVPNAGAGGTTPSTPAQGRLWSRAEINDFYAKVRTGVIKGADVAAIEAEIQRAMVEGRIR